MSRLLGPVLLFFGYTLVYASVAHGGVFATDPWNGIFADAYTDVTNGGSAPSSGSTGSSGTVKQKGPTATNTASSASNSGTPGGVSGTTGGGSGRRIRPVNNPAGGIGGAANSNFGSGLVPGSLTGPAQFTNGGGLLGSPPNFQLG